MFGRGFLVRMTVATSLIALLTVIEMSSGVPTPTTMSDSAGWYIPEPTRIEPDPMPSPDHPSFPRLTVINASAGQLVRLGEALGRFEAAGLVLPPLAIEFHFDQDECSGANGRFVASTLPWRITFCSTDVDSVYEHELAHAWERAYVTDAARVSFMRSRRYEVWASRSVSWNERGMEGAAVVIQQGLSGLALPPALGAEWKSRMAAFELLTGQPAPVLVEWLAQREVPCAERPTLLSLGVADSSGATCESGLGGDSDTALTGISRRFIVVEEPGGRPHRKEWS